MIAILIIGFMAFMSEQPGYTQDAAEFSVASPKQGASYRVQGVVRASKRPQTYLLCSGEACIPFLLDASSSTKPPVGQKIVVFGRWQQDVLEASQFITPCHDNIR